MQHWHKLAICRFAKGAVALAGFVALTTVPESLAQYTSASNGFSVVIPDALGNVQPSVDRIFQNLQTRKDFFQQYNGSIAVPTVRSEKWVGQNLNFLQNDPAAIFSYNGNAEAVVSDLGRLWSSDVDASLRARGYVRVRRPDHPQPFDLYVKDGVGVEYADKWSDYVASESNELGNLMSKSEQILATYSYPQKGTWSDPLLVQSLPRSGIDPLFVQKNVTYSNEIKRTDIPSDLKAAVRDFHIPSSQPKDRAKSLAVLLDQANRGEALAQFEFAEQLRLGNFVKRDVSQALKWYEQAAIGDEDISVLAALYAADLSFQGNEDGPAYERSKEFYELAAKKGDVRGSTWLGYMSLNGIGTERDVSQAVAQFEYGVKLNFPPAQYYLANMYEQGLYEGMVEADAVRLYASASRAGYRPAIAALAGKARSGNLSNVELNAEQASFSIYYATNRNFIESPTPDDRFYGSQRGDQLVFGQATVSMLLDDGDTTEKEGFFERVSGNIWKTVRDFFSDETGKFTTIGASQLSLNEFRGAIEREASGSTPGEDLPVLIFVHGFMNTFSSAAERAAQIAYAINFRGPVIVFSWPAQEQPLEYTIAGTEADWSAAYFDEFVNEVVSGREAYVVAHSKGNEVLLKFAFRHANNPSVSQFFTEMVLAAPDVDTQTFEQYREILHAMAARITLYTSDDDAALELARKVYGYRRLGDAGSGVLVAENVDTIDAGGAGEDLFGHAFSESKLIMEDVNLLLNHSFPPTDRRTDPIPSPPSEPKYWRLKAN